MVQQRCRGTEGGREEDGGWVWRQGHGRRIVTGDARRQGHQDREQSNTFAINGVILLGTPLGANEMSTPGLEPGLSRPRRDVLTTRRCGLPKAWFACSHASQHHGWRTCEVGLATLTQWRGMVRCQPTGRKSGVVLQQDCPSTCPPSSVGRAQGS